MKTILLQLGHLAMNAQAAPLTSFYLLVSIEVFFFSHESQEHLLIFALQKERGARGGGPDG